MRAATFLFSGEDEFRKRLSLDRLKNKLLGEHADAFNYDTYDAEQEDIINEVIRSLDTIPSSGKGKLVVLKEPELLPEEDKAKLSHYLQGRHPDSKTTLVLVSKKLPSPNDNLSAILSKHAKVINFSKLAPEEVPSWIIEEFRSRNKIINRQAVELIRHVAQGDTGRAFYLIEQITNFVGERDRIGEDDAVRFCEQPLEISTFKLLDYINDKDAKHSLGVLRQLLRSESSHSKIIGLLNWHLTMLIAVKKLLIKRLSKNDIAHQLNIKMGLLDRLIPRAENTTLSKLRRNLNVLFDTDLMLKRSGMKGEFLLEMLIVKLCA